MWELNYKESQVPKNWCFWTVMLEESFESPLDCKEIQPVHPKGNQSWMFFGRTDAEAETPILWPPDVKNWLVEKDSDGWARLKAGREGDDRGWDGWMVSPTQWTWVWVNSGSWWWTREAWRATILGSQTVRHDWVTELNWAELIVSCVYLKITKPGPVVPRTTVIPCISWQGLEPTGWGPRAVLVDTDRTGRN